MEATKDMKCPHCGKLFTSRQCKSGLTPYHDYPVPCRAVCPGSKHRPRNAMSDRRPLWKDDPELNPVVPIGKEAV